MTVPHHFQLAAGFPVYCIAWIAHDVLVYAGGGGKGRSGVGNFLRAMYVPATAQSASDVKMLDQVRLSSSEDAPMAMAVDPVRTKTLVLAINEADEGKEILNEHIRMYGCEVLRDAQGAPSVEFKFQSSFPSLALQEPSEAYVRLLRFSSQARQLVTASTEGFYALHEYPSMTRVFRPTEDFDGEEIMDADFSEDGNQLVICTGRKLKIFGTYPVPTTGLGMGEDEETDRTVSKTEATLAINKSLGKGPKSSLADVSGAKIVSESATSMGYPPTWHTIQNPALGGEEGCEFRAVRFGRTSEAERAKASITYDEEDSEDKKDEAAAATSAGKLFTFVNAKASSSSGKGKRGKRKSFLTSWSLPSPSLLLTRQLAEKPITACSLSPRGSLLAYGGSDLSIGVVETNKLRVRARILDAHAFPPTAVAWALERQVDPPPEPTSSSKAGVSSEEKSKSKGKGKAKGDSSPPSPSTTSSSSAASSSSSYTWLSTSSADGTVRLILVQQPPLTSSTSLLATDLVTSLLLRDPQTQAVVLTLVLAVVIVGLGVYIQRAGWLT